MNKIFWFDTETTGTDPKNHTIIQLAALIEVGSHIREKFSLSIRPIEGKAIDPKALEVNRQTKEGIMEFMPPRDAMKELVSIMKRYVDPYDPKDKYITAGYNVRFDYSFLRQWFFDLGDKYFGSWFHWPVIDVAQTFAEERLLQGTVLANYQLSTVCNYMGIYFEAHEALADIEATYKLYYKLRGARG